MTEETADYNAPPPGYTRSEDPRERICIASAGLYFNSDSGWHRSDGQPLRWLTFEAAWTQHKKALLSPGEQLVWATTFSLVLNGGSKAKLAARLATNAVDCLRMQAADPGDLYDAEVAHLQQMRGGR